MSVSLSRPLVLLGQSFALNYIRAAGARVLARTGLHPRLGFLKEVKESESFPTTVTTRRGDKSERERESKRDVAAFVFFFAVYVYIYVYTTSGFSEITMAPEFRSSCAKVKICRIFPGKCNCLPTYAISHICAPHANIETD